MKKTTHNFKINIFIFFVVFLFSFFLLNHKSFASVIYNTTPTISTSTNFGGQTGAAGHTNYIPLFITGTHATTTYYIRLYGYSEETPGGPCSSTNSLAIFSASNGSDPAASYTGAVALDMQGVSQGFLNTSAAMATGTFTGMGFDGGTQYYFISYVNSQNNCRIYGDASSSWSAITGGAQLHDTAPYVCIANAQNDVLPGGACDAALPATISIVYPTSTTPIFSHWVVSTTHNPDYPFTLEVDYSQSSSSLMGNYTGPYLIGRDPDYGNSGQVIYYIPSTLPANSVQATTTWYAIAYMKTPGPTIVTLASSSLYTFTIDNTAQAILVNSHQGFLGPAPSSTGVCISPGPSTPWDVTQWGPGIAFGLCSVAQVYFGNQAYSYQFMISQWNTFQNTFPFSIVFGNISSTLTAIQNASTTPTNQDYYFSVNYGGHDITFPLITSSSLENVLNTPHCDATCAHNEKETILGWERNLIWLATMIGVIYIII